MLGNHGRNTRHRLVEFFRSTAMMTAEDHQHNWFILARAET